MTSTLSKYFLVCLLAPLYLWSYSCEPLEISLDALWWTYCQSNNGFATPLNSTTSNDQAAVVIAGEIKPMHEKWNGGWRLSFLKPVKYTNCAVGLIYTHYKDSGDRDFTHLTNTSVFEVDSIPVLRLENFSTGVSSETVLTSNSGHNEISYNILDLKVMRALFCPTFSWTLEPYFGFRAAFIQQEEALDFENEIEAFLFNIDYTVQGYGINFGFFNVVPLCSSLCIEGYLALSLLVGEASVKHSLGVFTLPAGEELDFLSIIRERACFPLGSIDLGIFLLYKKPCFIDKVFEFGLGFEMAQWEHLPNLYPFDSDLAIVVGQKNDFNKALLFYGFTLRAKITF